MSNVVRKKSNSDWELTTMERRYSVPPPTNNTSGPAAGVDPHHPQLGPRGQPPINPAGGPSASEDLHAWSIYRQNLNSDFTDSALGSSEKSPLPYGNFQLRESTVQSILSHPRYGPKSALGANMYTYLKFGLPRVFPPSRGPRDGSSGYDSSDDGSPYLHRQGRNYLRSRSDPDFRNQPLHRPYSGHGPRAGPPITGTGGRGDGWVRTKSNSEANLLSVQEAAYFRHQQDQHRRSVHDLRALPYSEMEGQVSTRRRMSKAGSHASLTHNRRNSAVHHGGVAVAPRDEAAVAAAAAAAAMTLNSRLGPVAEASMLPRETYYAEHVDAAFKYPHLQVRGIEVESRSSRQLLLLQGISFEVHGGEIMAVMATAEEEGTGLLDALSGRSSNIGKQRGAILLNGQSVSPNQLRDRVAYVQCDSHLSPDLSVRQTLSLHHWLRHSSSHHGKLNTKDRIDALIEDLGLDQVRHTKVSGLTTSEKRRLNVACHLLLDTDIVVLDQPTRGMDIFDTFFLVEFLRQWAATAGSSGPAAITPSGVSGGRIVILTLHPPTYEIFTMLSRVALVSAGRLMFSGRRRDMLPYFAMVDYPCPAYKNPSDYYLDLVTLDDLSAEAMLESSQRIEQLAETFSQAQEPLSEPGPPIALPPKLRQANCVTQSFILITRALILSQPISLVRWLNQVLLAALMSLIIGAIWWDVPGSDPQLTYSDRPGFHYAMATLAPWPILLLTLGEVGRERWSVHRDVRDRLYYRIIYIFTKVLYNLPASICVWLAYLVPAYSMTGLHMQGSDTSSFYVYVGHMLIYLLCLQMLVTALGYMFKWKHIAAMLAGLLVTCLALVSGVPVHPADLGAWCKWLGIVSPVKWILPVLIAKEYRNDVVSSNTGMCRNKQVQRQDIIVQVTCIPPNGTAALQYLGLTQDPRQPTYMPPVAVAVFWFLCLLIAASCFLICRYRPQLSRNNPNKP
ncbi:ATP-binding cassette sub-family G member 8 [Periplaneta americana]|uniref:ATP-binding cassette sub-family G member 8 n=1 Tax=Periplaneta americana TaxID=6978 RepID=UPI0037E9AF0A